MAVRPSGDFDLMAVEPFDVEVDRAAVLAGDRVVVDLRALTFIDSSGLRALLAANERLAARGVSVRFVRPPQQLWRVFSVTGIDRLLPFDDAAASELELAEGEGGA